MATTYICARCGTTIRPKEGKLTHTFSRFTRNYYCYNLAACERRQRQATRKVQSESQ